MIDKTRFKVSIVALVAVAGGVFIYAFASAKPSSSSVTIVAAQTASDGSGSAGSSSSGSGASGSAGSASGQGSSETATVAAAPADLPSSTKSTKYKNGTYSATGTYESPGGSDDLHVTLTIRNDVVTAANVTSGANDSYSARYQDMFISGYKQYVIGQPLDSINLDYVSGSSLTPIGFNDAVSHIKAQARA